MKRKRFPPNQLSLDECLKRIRDACSLDTLDMIRRTSPDALHDDLGRWIRNNCGLWGDGTDRVVADIVIAHRDEKYQIPSLDDNTFIHPDIPFDIYHTHFGGCDRNLSHPVNCSGVIIEIFIDILKNEHESTNS